jgi:hypothetical protein
MDVRRIETEFRVEASDGILEFVRQILGVDDSLGVRVVELGIVEVRHAIEFLAFDFQREARADRGAPFSMFTPVVIRAIEFASPRPSTMTFAKSTKFWKVELYPVAFIAIAVPPQSEMSMRDRSKPSAALVFVPFRLGRSWPDDGK